MSENYCPSCGEQLPAASINITEGVALCPGCNQLSRLSDVVTRHRPVTEVLSNTPPGCSIDQRGFDTVVRATLRSAAGFIGTLFAALFWNGIVSVFVLIALAGLYTNLIGPLPGWFPAPDLDNLDTGMTLFLCIFLIPFVAIGTFLIITVLLSMAGKVEVVLRDREGMVRTGIGPLTWRRRFDPTQVHRVRIERTLGQKKRQPTEEIVLEADRTIKFGSMLRDDRREWLQTVLQELLTNSKADRRRDILSMAAQDFRSY